MTQANEPMSHKKTKHVLQRYYLIREIIRWGDVNVCKMHMNQNVADPLMKPLSQSKNEMHMRSMWIKYLYE
jgi:hypothetical protein